MIPVYLLDNEECIYNVHGMFISGGFSYIKAVKDKIRLECTVFKYKGWYYYDYSVSIWNSGHSHGANIQYGYRTLDELKNVVIANAERFAKINQSFNPKGCQTLLKLIDRVR